jgi:hypothetical protein
MMTLAAIALGFGISAVVIAFILIFVMKNQKKENEKEITNLRDSIRQIETFTVPTASATARKLKEMNGTGYGEEMTTRLRSLEYSVRDIRHAAQSFTFTPDTDMGRGVITNPTRLATDKYVSHIHDLINNLADVLGYKRNVHTSSSVCPDRWVRETVDEKKPRFTVLEPTGRIHDASMPATVVIDTLTGLAEQEMRKALAEAETEEFVEFRGRRRKK